MTCMGIYHYYPLPVLMLYLGLHPNIACRVHYLLTWREDGFFACNVVSIQNGPLAIFGTLMMPYFPTHLAGIKLVMGVAMKSCQITCYV